MKDRISTQYEYPLPADGLQAKAPPEPRVLVVVTVFNQAGLVPGIINPVLQLPCDVLVVDDGSTDDTATVLEGLDVQVGRHAQNRGQGAALLTACRVARSMEITHIVTVETDTRSLSDDFQGLYQAICRHIDALVIGRRRHQETGRRRMSSFWLRLQTGVSLNNPRCGFRAYPLAILENLTLRTRRRILFEVEILVRAAWAGVSIKEVDIRTPFQAVIANIPFYRIVWDRLKLALLNVHLTMRSITPLPHRKIVQDKDRPGEKISALHPLRSIRALLTENISPGQLALAGALGVFLGALPLIFLHNITILFAAGYLRLNKVAALVASTLCMPPLVPALCIEAGYFMRHGEFLTEISIKTIGYQAPQRLLEWLLGSLLLAPVLAALVGGIIYFLAYYIQKGMFQKKST